MDAEQYFYECTIHNWYFERTNGEPYFKGKSERSRLKFLKENDPVNTDIYNAWFSYTQENGAKPRLEDFKITKDKESKSGKDHS